VDTNSRRGSVFLRNSGGANKLKKQTGDVASPFGDGPPQPADRPVDETDKPALIIGNGRSREGLDLASLNRNAIVMYGCNALYREFRTSDFRAHYLAVRDTAMLAEMVSANVPLKTPLIVSPAARFRFGWHDRDTGWLREHFPPENIIDAEEHRPMTGEMVALHAARRGHPDIYLIGFDFCFGSNLYEGSINYEPAYPQRIARDECRSAMSAMTRQFPEIRWHYVTPEPDAGKLWGCDTVTIDGLQRAFGVREMGGVVGGPGP
jgi:hypothetical protein